MPDGVSELARRTAVIGGVTALIVIVVLVAWQAIPALLLIFCAFLIAVLLSGLAGAVAKRTKLSHGLALALTGVVLLGVLAGLFWFVGDGLVKEVARVGDVLPEGLERAEKIVRSWLADVGVEEIPSVPEAIPAPAEIGSRAFGFVGSFFGALTSVVLAILLGVFFAASPKTYRRGILHLVPKARRPRILEVMEAVVESVRKWLVARLLIMMTTFVLAWGGLSLLGVPFAGGLAVLSALAVFVPYIGPFIGGGVAAVVALLDAPQLALYTVLFYVVLENVQGLTIEPLLESHMTDAPPGLLLSAQVVLGLLLGAIGFVLASPLVVALTVLVQMLYVEDALGDDVRVLGEPKE
jgi:predicted PurR-regulated permease PerM